MAPERRTIAIIGAGIVGVATAIWLQRAGHDVILIDRAGPAEGTSFGNGGVLASCAVVPVTVPGLLWKAPKMLLSPDQPLFLNWGYLGRLMPWLLRYLSHATAPEARRIAAALMPILGDSLNDHRALAAGTGAEKWVVPSDYLYLYDDRAGFLDDAFAWGLRRDDDLVQDILVDLLRNLGADRFEGRSSLKTYVERVAKYRCIDALRRERHRRLW